MKRSVLLDESVLTALCDGQGPKQIQVEAWLRSCRDTKRLHLAPQSLYEFWDVATRPISENGRGLSVEDASLETAWLLTIFEFLPDPPNLSGVWLDLCISKSVEGESGNPARLAAYAELHGIRSLATFNPKDFTHFGLDLIVPA